MIYLYNKGVKILKIAKVYKSGTSLSFAIPAEVVKTFNIKRGDYISITIFEDGIFVCKVLNEIELNALQPPQVYNNN